MNDMQAKNGLLKRMSCFKHQTSEENPLILQQQQQQALLLNMRQQQQQQQQGMQFNPGMQQQQFMNLNNQINSRANQFSNANQYQNSEQISSEIFYNQQNNNPAMRLLPPSYNNVNNNMHIYNNPRMVNNFKRIKFNDLVS